MCGINVIIFKDQLVDEKKIQEIQTEFIAKWPNSY